MARTGGLIASVLIAHLCDGRRLMITGGLGNGIDLVGCLISISAHLVAARRDLGGRQGGRQGGRKA